MKSCTQCGAAASDGALKCPACKAWLVAAAPPGTPAPAPAPQPPAAQWSPPASSAPPAAAPPWTPPASSGGYATSAPVGAYQGQAQAYSAPAPAYPEQAPAYAAQAPAFQGQAPAYPGSEWAAYQMPEPAYQEQAPAYQGAAVADGDLFPSRAAAPAAPGAWGQPAAWQGSMNPGQPAARKGRLSLPRLPNITWDRKRAMPFVAGGCAIVVAIAGLWFFLGRSHSSHAPAKAAKTAAKPKPRGTAKQRAQANRAAQNDLRNALTAEKVVYVDNQTYEASPAALRRIEPTLAWGTRVKVKVGDASAPGDRSIVCISETTRYGQTWTVADVASGAVAGTYYWGRKACPARLTARAAAAVAPRAR